MRFITFQNFRMLILLFIVSGCNVVSQINRTTRIINENQSAIQRSTRVINENADAIADSTKHIRVNHEHVGLTNDAIKENLQAVINSSEAVTENAKLVKESSKTIGENQQVIQESNVVIAKNAAIVERLSKPIEHIDHNSLLLIAGGGLFLFVSPWLIIWIIGYRMNKNLRELLKVIKGH